MSPLGLYCPLLVGKKSTILILSDKHEPCFDVCSYILLEKTCLGEDTMRWWHQHLCYTQLMCSRSTTLYLLVLFILPYERGGQ